MTIIYKVYVSMMMIYKVIIIILLYKLRLYFIKYAIFTIFVQSDRCLLTNRLHCKAAELCLTYS